jgi:hypothetical protein
MLSETLTDGSGAPGPPPLGRLLIVHGFLTEEQLQAGLAEHGRTGLPLGQVLISLGFVTKAIIAQALATQAGGLVKTEYGFSTGFAAPEQASPLQFTSAAAPEADPQPVEPASQPEAEIIPLRQEGAPVETPMQIEAPVDVAAPADVEAPAQVESAAHAWSAPPEVTIPAPAPVAEIQPEPIAGIQPEPIAEIQPEPIAEIQPEPIAEEIQPEPIAEIQPEPIAEEIQPEPIAEIQPEPIAEEIQPEPIAEEIQPQPIAEIHTEPIAEEIQPEPAPVASHEQAEAALATAAARIDELQAELREQQRLTEASEAKLAEIALDADAARSGLNAAVQEFNALKQEVAAARQVELELRDENERLASAGPDPTPTRELQVVRMEIASMRNELATVVEALRAVHARLGEHSATAPAPSVPDAPAPAAHTNSLPADG